MSSSNVVLRECKNKLCKQPWKPLSEFYRDRSRKSGYSCYCRACLRERARAYYKRQRQLKRYRDQNARRREKVLNGGPSYTQAEWDALCEKYNYCCVACGQRKPLTADHVVPLDGKGTNGIGNIQPLCKACNSSKGTSRIDYRKRWEDAHVADGHSTGGH